MKILSKRIPALTLLEVLVVLIILGILVLLALPSVLPLITKAKSLEAQLQLEQVYNNERAFYFVNSEYTKDLNTISFEQQKLSTEGGRANYKIEIIDASFNKFKARATAVKDFDGDGTFNQWEIDQDKNLIETVKD